jgi:hypothetical protein
MGAGSAREKDGGSRKPHHRTTSTELQLVDTVAPPDYRGPFLTEGRTACLGEALVAAILESRMGFLAVLSGSYKGVEGWRR